MSNLIFLNFSILLSTILLFQRVQGSTHFVLIDTGFAIVFCLVCSLPNISAYVQFHLFSTVTLHYRFCLLPKYFKHPSFQKQIQQGLLFQVP